jgi:hypothetical protein
MGIVLFTITMLKSLKLIQHLYWGQKEKPLGVRGFLLKELLLFPFFFLDGLYSNRPQRLPNYQKR